MLEYLYCNSVSDINQQLATDLLVLSHNYHVLGLKGVCENFLVECLNTDNLVSMANLCEEVDSEVMRNAVVKYMKKTAKEMNEREDLFEIPKNILYRCLFESGNK